MNRTVAIGLGTALVGVIGTIVLDRFTHGGTHTILTIVMIVLLITAALVLHRQGETIRHDLEQPAGRTKKR